MAKEPLSPVILKYKYMKRIKISQNFVRIISIAILAIAALIVSFPGIPYWHIGNQQVGKTISELRIRLGLDLQGGTYLVYKANLDDVEPQNYSESLEGARDVIERRVNAFGISEPLVQTSKTGEDYKIIVELAGIKNVHEAIKMIGETPILDFREQKNMEDAKRSEEDKQAVIKRNEEKQKEAQDILDKAKKGKSFSKLAKDYSQDEATKPNGGDLDFFGRGVMQQEFEDVAFNEEFKKDTVWPELVQTSYGYHIIKKTDEKDEEVRVSHILIKTENEEYDETVLESMDFQDPFKQTTLTGRHLERAEVGFNPNTGEPEVYLQFNNEGKKIFREITERNLDKIVPIYLDGEPITMPVIKAVITDGKAVISGGFSLEEAKQLSQRLNAGALPIPIELVHQQTIGASLGQKSLEQSLVAGLIGLTLVILFIILVYRWPGIVAAMSLVIYALLIITIFKVLKVTLTLSGIAGLILSIGMAVDANVLIFERIKEELKSGKWKIVAIQEGFKRAWPSIRDGNVSTIITCLILSIFSTGMVKGFALTLGIGVLLSMFTAIVITRSILEASVINQERGGWWWGISDKNKKS